MLAAKRDEHPVRPLLLPLIAILALAGCRPAPPASHLIVWAWERPEDLRFADPSVEVAVQHGFIELRGTTLFVRGRRFPLKVDRPPSTVTVHVQIDHERPLVWSPELRRRLVAAIVDHATLIPGSRVQLDFEVRESERPVLLDTLSDLRRALPAGTFLSMTAIASWCDHETWLKDAPVDEIVPMLFRMGPRGKFLLKSLENREDFRNPRCRTALAISTDTPIVRAPPGRRVYLFNPGSWTPADLDRARQTVEAWR